MNRVTVKVPQQGVVREGVGIVTMNHLGSSIHEDTGRDAQALADRFRVLTIAADRPVSLHRKEMAAALATDAVSATMNIASAIDHIADTHDLKTLLLAGRSAAGLSILELALTEGISNARLVYAAEPVGSYALSAAAGKARFAAYQVEQKALLAADDALEARTLVHPNDDARNLPLPARLKRMAAMVPLFLRDRALNTEHWAKALVPDYLTKIASAGLPARVEFAEHSLVLPDAAAERQQTLEDMLATAANSNGLLVVETVPGTTHASFDNRDFFGDRLQAASAPHDFIIPPPEF